MICLPAFVYLVLCCIQIILDFIYGLYNTAIIKIIVTIILTFILNLLCYMDLGFIAWVIVLVPFIFMSVIVTIILYVVGYDAATGSIDELTKQPIKFQTNFTSPPIPPKLLPAVPIQPPIKNNVYLIPY